MNKMEERKMQRIYEFVGITKEESIEVNQLRDELVKAQEVYNNNLKQFNYVLESLEVQKFFLVSSAKRLKSNQKKYNDFRATQLKSTEQEVAKYQVLVENEKELLELTNKMLELYDSKVDIESKGHDENGDELITLTYEKGFYDTLVLFAKTFGILK